jgi:serine/threonine protein kinase
MAVQHAAPSASGPDAAQGAASVGASVGAIGDHLTAVRRLGRGGLSEVYQVWSSRWWSSFACKTLPADACHDGAARRALLREGRILRAVAHPGIVRLFEIQAGPRPYLVLEYLGGPLASDLVDRHGPLPVDAAVRLAMHVGAALVHVHRRGYLHLDVKPENVAIVDSRPILFDFSLARRQGPHRPAYREGTPAAMAPEQCLRHHLAPATDVFGLGYLLYRLLTGHQPFRAGRRAGLDGAEPAASPDRVASLALAYPQLVDDPTPLSGYRPELPVELERVVLGCLKRDPADRFQEMSALIGALAPFAQPA